MADVKVYNPKNVIVIACGVPITGGFAAGSKVKAVQVNETFVVTEGVEGDMTRTNSNSQFTRITFRLLQTSRFNAVLSALHAADKASENGSGVAPTTIKDKGGASLHFLSQSWLTKIPDSDYAGEDTFREWVIEGIAEVNVTGGN